MNKRQKKKQSKKQDQRHKEFMLQFKGFMRMSSNPPQSIKEWNEKYAKIWLPTDLGTDAWFLIEPQ